jgi:hypothetical protein
MKIDAQTVLAILSDVDKHPDAYAEPRPVVGVPNMPEDYDLTLVINELERLRVFEVQARAAGNVLVPVERIGKLDWIKPNKEPRVNLGCMVPPDVRDRAQAAANAAGKTLSAFVAEIIEANV